MKLREKTVLRLVKIIFAVLWILTTANLHAKSQALLIGIGQYPEQQLLEGPVNDVALLRNILLQNENFSNEHIKVLLNEEATKSNILNTLNGILESTVRGDKIVLYFSGHGTSALNTDIDADLPSYSGALVPYDIGNISSKDELNKRLLIGRRDLRPVLSKLDATGAEVLVLVDACFSGNVVRGDDDARILPQRVLNFSELLQFQQKEPAHNSTALLQTVKYPYKNVFLVAAAQEDQSAHDIPKNKVSQFGTVDAKPHGAFTDSFVQALVKLYENDNRNNSPITLTELHVATRRRMKEKGLFSTPSLLPNDPVRTNATPINRFFGPI